MNIEHIRSEVMKERRKLISKGVSQSLDHSLTHDSRWQNMNFNLLKTKWTNEQ
jgi:hypothetical protein